MGKQPPDFYLCAPWAWTITGKTSRLQAIVVQWEADSGLCRATETHSRLTQKFFGNTVYCALRIAPGARPITTLPGEARSNTRLTESIRRAPQRIPGDWAQVARREEPSAQALPYAHLRTKHGRREIEVLVLLDETPQGEEIKWRSCCYQLGMWAIITVSARQGQKRTMSGEAKRGLLYRYMRSAHRRLRTLVSGSATTRAREHTTCTRSIEKCQERRRWMHYTRTWQRGIGRVSGRSTYVTLFVGVCRAVY